MIWDACATEPGGNRLQTILHTLPRHQQGYMIHDFATGPGYKSLHLKQGTDVNDERHGMDIQPAYINTNQSDTSGSVKYYVLEDTKGSQ